MSGTDFIEVKTIVKKPLIEVWRIWTEPEHIKNWNSASPDWHTTKATNDIRNGGKFSSSMAAKDGSISFDFEGIHEVVEVHKLIKSTLGDGRKMEVHFSSNGNETQISERFQPESENSRDLQQTGWQAILDNFKKYTQDL